MILREYKQKKSRSEDYLTFPLFFYLLLNVELFYICFLTGLFKEKFKVNFK